MAENTPNLDSQDSAASTLTRLEDQGKKSNLQKPSRCFLELPALDTWVLSSPTNIAKLYDRAHQQNELLTAYQRRRSPASSMAHQREFVLISGASGTGKTALAFSIREKVTADSGFFIAGKFDQLQRPEPYSPFRVAFTDLVRQIMEQGDEDYIKDIQRRLMDSVDSMNMISDMIPALRKLLGPASEMAGEADMKSGGHGAQGRFVLVFCQFVRAICSLERPLVLFVDDLQWAEPASTELCAALVADSTILGLTVLGACRGNEVAIEHHLAVTLRELEADRVVITHIEVGNVSELSFHEMLQDMFHLPEPSGGTLADLVHHYTDGNIFFAMEFLKSLQKVDLLVCDGSKWSWQPKEEVLSTLHYDNVVDFIRYKIGQLSPYEQEVIKIASCLGCEFDDALIRRIVESDEATNAVDALESNGLIVKQHNCDGYRFRHDRIQQASLNMIPDEQKAAFHLSIGRALLQALSSDEIHDNIFLIVNLLHVGVDLIESQQERTSTATLCLRAGEKASVSSAFLVASRYLNLGLCLLGHHRWRNHYGLTLDLTNEAAEVAYCNADYDCVDALTASVFSGARCFEDKVRAHTTHLYSLGSRNSIQRAIDIGFEVLRELGEPFPKKGRIVYILLNLVKTNRMLRNKTLEDIVNLPRLRDSKKLAAIRIMNLIFPYCIDARLEFAPLVAMRIIQVTLKSGISGMSCAGFGAYASVLASVFGDVSNGYRVGQIAMAILERFAAKEWTARVYTACYGLCFPWRDPLRNSLKPLLVAHRVGLNTGDIEFSMLSGCMYAGVAIFAGCKLDKLLNEFHNFYEMMKANKQYKMLAYIRTHLQLVHNFTGKSVNPAVLHGDILDSKFASDQAIQEQNFTVMALLHLYNLLLAYFFNDYELASEHAIQLSNCKSGGFSSFTLSAKYLMEGMATIAGRRPSSQQKRFASQHLRRLKKCARLCPANVSNKVYLLEAEIAGSSGNSEVALLKYRRAIDQAAKENIYHEKALACERAGMFLVENDRICQSIPFFSQAAASYEEWGCKTKADQMRARIEILSKDHPEITDDRSESA